MTFEIRSTFLIGMFENFTTLFAKKKWGTQSTP